jgi:hypothetical protein
VATNSGGANITGNVLYSFSIPDQGGYDAFDNLKSVTDSVTGTWNYNYDNLNRLAGSLGLGDVSKPN